MNSVDTTKITECNRRAWDASATLHGSGQGWERLVADLARPDFSTLDATLTEHLQAIPLKDRTVVQVGCNNGRELLSVCSLGARSGLGIDQSAEFLKQAEKLGAIAVRDVTFLRADIYALPDDVPKGFDIALITIGVLNWMPDLPRFFAIVADLLGPAGTLLIYETHPVLDMFDPKSSDPMTLADSYFRRHPHVSDEAIVYDGSEGSGTTSYWFPHTIGDILNACIDAGFVIDRFSEYPHSNREVDYALYEHQDAQLPMCYVLRASKIAG